MTQYVLIKLLLALLYFEKVLIVSALGTHRVHFVMSRSVMPISRTTQLDAVDPLVESDASKGRQRKLESLLWLVPWISGACAYSSFELVASNFHSAVEAINQANWKPGDDFESGIDLPALRGPLTTSLSIMLGTLVAVTVSSLYNRQVSIQGALVSLEEEVCYLKMLIQNYPQPYRELAREKIDEAVVSAFDDVRDGVVTPESMRERTRLPAFVELINDLSEQPNAPKMIDESFGCVQRLVNARARMISAALTTFPLFHYGTLGSLSLAIATLFLIEADSITQQYQAGFQLRLSWSILFWVFSMLAILLYDLSRPFSGVFQISVSVLLLSMFCWC
jgi:hypothetical protein